MTSQHPLRFLQIFTGNFPGTRRQSLPRRYEHGLPVADSTWALFGADFCRLCTTRSLASLRPSRSAGRLASEHGQPAASGQRPNATFLGASRWLAGLAGLVRVCTLVFLSPHLPAQLPIVCDGRFFVL